MVAQSDAEETNNELEQMFTALNPKEQIFCREYLRNGFNKMEAALSFGAAKASAANQGVSYSMRPPVKAYLSARIKADHMTVDEIGKSFAKMANTNMAKYFKKTEVLETPKKKITLREYIQIKRVTMEIEQEYVMTADIDQAEADRCDKAIKGIKNDITRLELELERNPAATRIVNDEPRMVTKLVPNIAKMVRDQIPLKSIKVDKEGHVSVEAYSAIEAKAHLLKMQGGYAADNAQKRPLMSTVDLDNLPNDVLLALANAGTVKKP